MTRATPRSAGEGPCRRLSALLGIDSAGPVVIGEVGQAHDGSLGLAHQFVDAIADAGAHAVKFQTHIAAAESTPAEPWRVRFSYQDETRFDYWRRMEFTEAQWQGLADHARERGLLFLSTPFSIEALELLERVGVAAWKVASGEVTNLEMVERMSGSLPVLLSSGMSALQEVDQAVDVVRKAGSEVLVMQCTSAYPTGPAQVGLNLLEEYRQRWDCGVGLSDHSGTVFPSLAAAALGADVLEVHVTLSRRMFGPDVPASVTVEELRQLCEGTRFIGEALESPVDKDAAAEGMHEMRRLFTKSLVAARPLGVGHRLESGDLVPKKPGGGIDPADRESILGRRLVRPLQQDQQLTAEDLES